MKKSLADLQAEKPKETEEKSFGAFKKVEGDQAVIDRDWETSPAK